MQTLLLVWGLLGLESDSSKVCVGLTGVSEILEMSATFVVSILAMSGFWVSFVGCRTIGLLLDSFSVFVCFISGLSGSIVFVVVLVKKELDLIDNGSAHAAIGFITRECYSSLALSQGCSLGVLVSISVGCFSVSYFFYPSVSVGTVVLHYAASEVYWWMLLLITRGCVGEELAVLPCYGRSMG